MTTTDQNDPKGRTMTNTELEQHRAGTDLTIAEGQHAFTDQQRAALAHIGVADAPEGDLGLFFHVAKRSGLDPFARQIYMIGRQESQPNPNGDGWVKVTKWTIQTGIDGFRLIGRRAAARARQTVSVEAVEWAGEQRGWSPVWSKSWGNPVAARVTIRRDGDPFTATALFDEYAQTKRNGELTRMWAQRPGGQIAKCAEALAWRMAFPQDLSGIYTDDEMQQADRPAEAAATAPARDRLATLAVPAAEPDVVDAEVEPDEPSLAELFDRVGLPDNAARLAFCRELTDRPDIATAADLTNDEMRAVRAALIEQHDEQNKAAE
ncbi:recombinase RecT [Luteipulveratus halotolerans]|uniref:recombinase RecT n=1 Tax=Luteipulveratus halotolerans TaxID=1631356 RepID=UPI000A977AF0|nr:recombinase RecT [Luteipulveratus halotolerans]